MQRLKAHSKNDATQKVHYYLGIQPVCRTFYRLCYGLSKPKCNKISHGVTGLPNPPRPPAVVDHHLAQTQENICLCFWREFIGDQAQTSGSAHRYLPANTGCENVFYIYFWPWYKMLRQRFPMPSAAVASPFANAQVFAALTDPPPDSRFSISCQNSTTSAKPAA